MKKAYWFFSRYILILLFLSGPFRAVAQTYPDLEWARGLGSTGSDKGTSIAVDGSGNVYAAGTFEGTVDFDPGSGVFTLSSIGGPDIFIAKLDAYGDFLWAKQIAGDGEAIISIALDASNNIHITGIFNGTTDFDPGTNVLNYTSAGNDDVFICKLNSSGVLVWAKQIGGIDYEAANSLAVDVSGNVYTVGFFDGTVDFDPGTNVLNLNSSGSGDVYILKLDSSGSLIWVKQMGGNNYDNCLSIALDNSGNFYITGFFTGTVDFDPNAGVHNLTSNGNEDVFIGKLSTSGNFVWAKSWGSSGSYEEGSSVAVDGSGNVYVLGDFMQTVDFDPGTSTFNLSSAGSTDGFISKLDSSGNFLWASRFGGNSLEDSNSIEVDANKNIYITALFQGTIDFTPAASTITSVGGDILIGKLNNVSGNFEYVFRIEGSGFESPGMLVTDDFDNLYVTGLFGPMVDFDPGSGNFNITSAGQADAFVLKLKENLSIVENLFANNIILYPNPVSHKLNISSTWEIDQVSIYDLLGRKVIEEHPNSLNVTLNLESLTSGTYIVEITAGEKKLSRKVLKE